MKSYTVVAEFVDSETGNRFSPAADGQEPVTFTPHDDEQAERLLSAGCLSDDGNDAPKAKAAPKAAAKAKDAK